MDNIIDVATGEVKVGRNNKILVSNAIGSCVAVILYDNKNKSGAIAHVMLPGKAPDKTDRHDEMKYAYNAINEILRRMTKSGPTGSIFKGFIIGGGNVLRDKNDTICKDNIKSVTEILNTNKINILAKAIGGTERRSVSLDISSGVIRYSEGDSREKILWEFKG